MSRETERYLERLIRQMEAEGVESEEEIDAFLTKYNETLGAGGSSDGPGGYMKEDEAYEEYVLGCELIYSDDPEEEREAVRHLKKAIKLDPPFYDAQLQLLMLEQDTFKLIEKLKALEAQAEQGCLEKCGFERAEVFGEGWMHIDMRPFLRIKHRLAMQYLGQGMLGLAKEKFEELLAWTKNDNQGCRYILIGLYAYFEDEDQALKLYNNYNKEQAAWNLLSLAVLYYKLNDAKSSLSFIRRLAKAIPDTYETIYRILTDPEDTDVSEYSHYRPGSSEELQLAIGDLDFLIATSVAFLSYFFLYAFEQYEKQAESQRMPKVGRGKKAAKRNR